MKTLQTTEIFKWLEDHSNYRQILLYGGAGSGKSTSAIIYLLKKAFTYKNLSILITRRTTPSLRLTVYKLTLDLLQTYFDGQYEHNKTEMIITIPSTGSEIIFKSIDDEAKIRSLTVSDIFIEECAELSESQYDQLQLRLRKQVDSAQQLLMATNPISVFTWPYQRVFLSDDKTIAKHKSDWSMNPFLDKDYVKQLHKLKGNNRTVYLEGNWGKLEGLIFTDYEVIDKIYDTVKDVSAGLDFGYTAPSALVFIHHLEGGGFIAEEKLYQEGLTNTELIRRLEKIIPDKSQYIYADGSEPARIEEIRRAGYYMVRRANKDVSAGLDYSIENLKAITSQSINLRKELQTYSWSTDSMDRLTSKPNKEFDHAIDAMRMGAFSHRGRRATLKNLKLSFR
jgi:phage terminase large subunit